MKRLIPLALLVIIYVLFVVFLLSPGGGHHAGGMYEIVVGHLTDHPLTIAEVTPKDNVLTTQLKAVNNAIASLNNTVLKDKLFGIFDMRITKWLMMMWVAGFLCILVFIPLGREMRKSGMVPESRWVNMWESLIGFVHDEIVEPNFEGKYAKKAMPYFGTVFFFILFCNLLGLIPGTATATGNLAVTGGLAIFTFFGMIIIGTVKQGPLWIITGIVPHGIPMGLFPLLWVIELMGLLIKPFALTVRLFANMTAGHVVIIIFLYLIMMFQQLWIGIPSILGSLMIFLLELLVAFIQAYIFATLSAMFIGSSMHAH